MGASKLHKGWGIIFVVSMATWLSSCAKTESIAHDQPTFDFFSDECIDKERAGIAGIVGGKTVQPYSADSDKSVLLTFKTRDGGQGICSATLISERTLLTAAHCVNEAAQMQAIFYTDITCSSGYRRSEHAIVADQFIYHPSYDSSEDISAFDENPDVAVVHLSQAAPNSYPVFKISDNPEVSQSDYYMYGYGVTGTGKRDSALLRSAIVKRENVSYQDKAVFFGQYNSSGVCNGDSGGAGLIYENEELVIASVNSLVFKLDPLDKTEDYCNRYSKSVIVHHYKNWISSTMSKWDETLK